MEDPGYYNVPLAEAAHQFDVAETDVRSWLQRGALDGQLRDGQWWVHLGPRRDEETVVRLWHGTSTDRVATLLERAFWTVTVGKQFGSQPTSFGRGFMRLGVLNDVIVYLFW